ncbi:MAG: hypothetical protein IPK06_12450 [Ignavibacteriae bacterium]|nr:hypothetical protein [Ignavibacteriota bacterium]
MSYYKNIDKYLTKFDLPKWKVVQRNENEKFSNIIVIPAISEFENIIKLTDSILLNNLDKINKTLALFVINNKKNDSNEIKTNNFHSIQYLNKLINKSNENLKFGFIDCSTEGNEPPEKDAGAGLARKIGMDSALTLFDYQIKTQKIIISLDADCLITQNYIQEIQKSFINEKINTAVINFEHQLSENTIQNLGIINYEIFLRHYILGLKYANSAFAFHTIGSAFAVDPEIYVKVGGMNKRKGGEDFYFLQKAGKISDVKKIENAKVFPSSRVSWRVPFGTGPRIKRFLENQVNEYFVYSTRSFFILKKWNEILNESKNICKNVGKDKKLIEEITFDMLLKSKSIHHELYNFLISQNFINNWQNILQNSSSEKQLSQNIKNWMDGFRTLKLIHHLRDSAYPNEKMFESVNELFSLSGSKTIEFSSNINFDFEKQMGFLTRLRELT